MTPSAAPPALPGPRPDSRFDPAFALLEAAVGRGDPPAAVGAVLEVEGRGGGDAGAGSGTGADAALDLRAHGVRRLGPGAPAAGPGTRFDLASLTKVVATLPAALRLAAAGELDLDAPLIRYLPAVGDFRPSPHPGDATARDLLAHRSGLPAWRPLNAVARDRLTLAAAAWRTPLERPPGAAVVYSDLGMILLGLLVEAIAFEPLERFVAREVFEPLGMRATGFGPLEPPPPGAGRPAGDTDEAAAGRLDAAATERCGWRRRVLVGEVHDENAWAFGGVAGHAGLFGTAADLARYARAWLELDPRLAPEALLREATRPQAEGPDGVRRGLGWALAPAPSAGASASRNAFGHTGYTGTSLWIDPERGRAAVLLTNRVHPSRTRAEGIAALRPAFADAVFGAPA